MTGFELTDDVIELRPLTLDDAQEHLAGEDPEWERWLSGGPGTIDGVRRAIATWMEHWERNGPVRNFGVVDRRSGRLVGNIELNLSGEPVGLSAGEANIAYGTFAFARGTGIATRAVRLACEYLRRYEPEMRLAVIRAEPGNIGSVAVANSAGFRFDREIVGDGGRPMLRYELDLDS